MRKIPIRQNRCVRPKNHVQIRGYKQSLKKRDLYYYVSDLIYEHIDFK